MKSYLCAFKHNYKISGGIYTDPAKMSGDIREKKDGILLCDRELFEDIVMETGAGNCRHPLTFILEAADDIAYKTADIEDAFVKGFITYHSLRDELRKLQNREKKLAVPEQAEWNRFRPADKLVELYERAKQKRSR